MNQKHRVPQSLIITGWSDGIQRLVEYETAHPGSVIKRSHTEAEEENQMGYEYDATTGERILDECEQHNIYEWLLSSLDELMWDLHGKIQDYNMDRAARWLRQATDQAIELNDLQHSEEM